MIPRIFITIFSCLAAIILFISCSTQYPMLSTRSQTEAQGLKQACAGLNLSSPETTRADSLYTAGNALLGKKNYKPAYHLIDKAVVLYNVALLRHEYEKSNGEIAQLRESLEKAENELSSYRDILRKIKNQ